MYRWNVLSKYTTAKELVRQLLDARGIIGEKEQDTFLNPPTLSYWFKNLPKDFLQSLKCAKNEIEKAISKGNYILIHGDYDVDGVCAGAILYNTIKNELGYDQITTFIPNRFEHGYGLSKKSITSALGTVPPEKLKDTLLITVDSGVTSVNEVDYLKKLGCKVIITDHHQKPKKLPDAHCLVWNDQIVGASIAWLLSKVLGSKDNDNLALCAIATIADLQPVIGFNRTIVKAGLQIINTTPPPGIKALLEVAGKANSKITTYDLGWIVGPRLNASGRVEDASNSVDLLTQKDPEKLTNIAWKLNKINSQRQDKTIEMYELASAISSEKLPKIIISHHENYHEGIIGLVASRLVQKYYRPSIVISTGSDIAKASVRSIPGVNIIEMLREFDDLFISLGGHPMAAGFSIETQNIAILKSKLEAHADLKLNEELFEQSLDIDMELPVKEINIELIKNIDNLKPFGIGNGQPVFASYTLGLTAIDFMGQERNHVRLKLFDNQTSYKAVFFNGTDAVKDLTIGDYVDIAYTLKENQYNGNVYIDLILKDIKKSDNI